MSQLDQAKKEAKRLFNLAKANQEKNQSQEIELSIPKLSAAREIVAVMNGYKNWHDYEEVLKRKDYVFARQIKIQKIKKLKRFWKIKNILFKILNLIPFIIQINLKRPSSSYEKVIISLLFQVTKKEKSFFENKEKY